MSTASSSDPWLLLEGCKDVFVGGGWGGIYSLYRRVRDDPSRAATSCLMEESWRLGGRTYSVSLNHSSTPFVQDIGAYRFTPDMHLVGDLILRELNLTTTCYESNRCPPAHDDFPKPFLFNFTAPLRRIVDPSTGLPTGYVTPLHKMIQQCRDMGVRVFTQMRLSRLQIGTPQHDTTTTTTTTTTTSTTKNNNNSSNNHNNNPNPVITSLDFQDTVTGRMVSLDQYAGDLLILNLPRNKFMQVQGASESLHPIVRQTLECIVFDVPERLFGAELAREIQQLDHYTTNLAKAYLYYEDAWWQTKLHQYQGTWPPNLGFAAADTPQGVKLNLRWHDGPVLCNNSKNNNTAANDDTHDTQTTTTNEDCHGLLEVYYSVSNETFYSSLSPADHNDTIQEPLGSIWDTDGPQAHDKLLQAHQALVQSLTPLLKQYQINPQSLQKPLGMIVGTWHRPHLPGRPFGGHGYTAPTKVYYDPKLSGFPDKACGGVHGLTDESYRDTVLQPWGNKTIVGGVNIFLVNNDYVCQDVAYFFGDWAEESLWQAERAMHLLGMSMPPWNQNASYYQHHVINQIGTQHLLHQTTNTKTTTDNTDEVGVPPPPVVQDNVSLLPSSNHNINKVLTKCAFVLSAIGMAIGIVMMLKYQCGWRRSRRHHQQQQVQAGYTPIP